MAQTTPTNSRATAMRPWGNQLGDDKAAGLAQLCKLVVELVTTGARFVAKVQHFAIEAQLMEQLDNGRWRVGDFSKVNRFRAQTARNGNDDAVFENVKAQGEVVQQFPDLPPELWRWVDKGFAPINLTHLCQVGRSSIVSTPSCPLRLVS